MPRDSYAMYVAMFDRLFIVVVRKLAPTYPCWLDQGAESAWQDWEPAEPSRVKSERLWKLLDKIEHKACLIFAAQTTHKFPQFF